MVGLKTIIITGMVTGSISVVSSLSIILLILRSRKMLSHTFHRIMVGLSLADIFLSLAISFGTIPSPMGPYAAEFARGNTSTCDAQGFFYLFGTASAPLYSITLQLYFLLRIKYNLAKEKLVKNVEPFLHAAPIVYGLIAAIVPLSLGSINETSYGSCFISSHPFGCRGNVSVELALNKGNECTRSIKIELALLRWIIFGIPHLIIFIFLCVISWMMYFAMRELELRKVKHMFLPSDETLRKEILQQRRIHERSQKILKRAFSYLAAFALPFINALLFVIVTWTGHYNSIYTLVISFVYPLHGLYNLIVFLWPLVMKLKEENEDFSLLQNTIIAIQTYDRAPRRDKSDSSTSKRMSLIDWALKVRPLRKSVENLTIHKNESSGQNTESSYDREDVREDENNASCQSLRDSDEICLSDSENNGLNTSCQSFSDIDGVSESKKSIV